MGHYYSYRKMANQTNHKSEVDIKREREAIEYFCKIEGELCTLLSMEPKKLERVIELIFEYKRLMY